MGQHLSQLSQLSPFHGQSFQVVTVGLDNAGKSTIIYRIKLNRFVQQASTVGFNYEKVVFTVLLKF